MDRERGIVMATILCPVDGSDHADTGLAHAAELARLKGVHLTICAVNLAIGGARGPTINQWTDAEAEALLAKAEADALAAGATDVGTAVLIAREAAPAILTYAEEIGADHIVLGTGDKRGVRRLVLGSVAAEVAGQAACSVTVAR
jgi:nucleotide-binding universal stress UspA family protein